MTIVELCFSKAWGGLEMRFVEDACHLRDLGHRVIPVVCPGAPAAERLVRCDFEPRTFGSLAGAFPLVSLRLARFFRRWGVEAVHIHRSRDLGPVLLAADLANVSRRVFTLRMESHRRKFDPYHRWIYHRLTFLLTITEHLRRVVVENRPIEPHKVRCLYNGFDFTRLRAEAEPRAAIRGRWGIGAGDFVVGMVGRLDPLKGQDVLLRAAGMLADEIPALKVMIVGDETVGEPGQSDRLKRLAGELGLVGRVVFTGYQHPPGRIVPGFDVAVLATRRETFGNVAVEALALGVPVVATDAGGVTEIVDHGVDGLLVKPEDPADLARAIEKLYRQPELRRKMGDEGARRMPERFPLERHTAGLEAALRGGSPVQTAGKNPP